MDQQEIRALLEQVAQGQRSVDEAVLALKMEPFQELGFAKVDNHRARWLSTLAKPSSWKGSIFKARTASSTERCPWATCSKRARISCWSILFNSFSPLS